jgi:hypothetical protein
MFRCLYFSLARDRPWYVCPIYIKLENQRRPIKAGLIKKPRFTPLDKALLQSDTQSIKI